MSSIPDRSIHSVLTDPPYASTDCSWDKPFDLIEWWKQIDRITVETGIVACFAAQPFATDLINSARKSFRYDLIWDKLAPVGYLNANRQPMRVHELILVFCRKPGKSIYNPQFTIGRPYKSTSKANRSAVYSNHKAHSTDNPGRRHPTSILRYPKPSSTHRLHPTEKPVSILEWMVLSWSRPGTVILDPFMGSGTTGEAALKHGRRFVGIESNESFYRISSERLSRFRNGV